MNVASKKRVKFALWVLLVVALVMMTAGTIFAAGEQLERSSVVSGGGTTSSGGFVLMSTTGLPVAGSDIVSNGGGLCSGFGCSPTNNVIPDDPGPDPDPDPDPSTEIFIPSVSKREAD